MHMHVCTHTHHTHTHHTHTDIQTYRHTDTQTHKLNITNNPPYYMAEYKLTLDGPTSD